MSRLIRIILSMGFLAAAGCEMIGKTAGPAGPSDEPLAEAKLWNFDSDPAGKLPPGWQPGQTRPSKALAAWAVVADDKAASRPNVLALTKTENARPTFNLAIVEKSSFKDLDLTVKVKANTGRIDQGGGPIWRCRDENNYYICRINPLENNYRVYRVVNGNRRELASAVVTLEAGKWYTLRVKMVGECMVCYLNGKKMLEARDGTIPWAGPVGVWTKADAATSFDDLAVKPVAGP